MKVLVAYATSEGHTRIIAEYVSKWIEQEGFEATLYDTAQGVDVADFSSYGAYICAGSVHFSRHQPALERFVRAHLVELTCKPSALISASGSAGSPLPQGQVQAMEYVTAFLSRTGWKPLMKVAVGGAVLYTQYNPLLRMVMKGITRKAGGPTDTRRDHESTDWPALRIFVQEFLSRAGSKSALEPVA
ncbi:MAG: protoporphyrinogen oxidase [Armatimonadetes bacterium]|nr:protoporphyrinogen oxidase [Armatimonadota bacterium]